MVRRTTFVLNFAFSHLKWLPEGSLGNEAFRSACERAGVSKIVFLRHGKTAPKPKDGLDFDRVLTDEGRDQAREAGATFGQELLPFYRSILVSPAPRTVETAQLFLQSAETASDRECDILPVQRLYDGSMQPEGSKLFQKIGYAPLRDYVDSQDANDRDISRQVFGAYSATAMEAIADTILVDPGKEGDTSQSTLWLVGHAVYLSSAALGVASLLDCNSQGIETILSANTKEAEGFLVDVENAQAVYLSRPSSELI